ncbi:MAG: hypothetical protein ACPGVD_08085 [Flavobacteriales bacterium]
MQDKLDILDKIQKVDAPEFLYTRIINSIENRTTQSLSKAWVWSAAACLSCVIALNVFAFSSFEVSSSQDTSLSTNNLNLLYNE